MRVFIKIGEVFIRRTDNHNIVSKRERGSNVLSKSERITSFLLFVSKKIKTVQTIVALQIERNTQ